MEGMATDTDADACLLSNVQIMIETESTKQYSLEARNPCAHAIHVITEAFYFRALFSPLPAAVARPSYAHAYMHPRRTQMDAEYSLERL
jgi:hypothetical protein